MPISFVQIYTIHWENVMYWYLFKIWDQGFRYIVLLQKTDWKFHCKSFVRTLSTCYKYAKLWHCLHIVSIKNGKYTETTTNPRVQKRISLILLKQEPRFGRSSVFSATCMWCPLPGQKQASGNKCKYCLFTLTGGIHFCMLKTLNHCRQNIFNFC